MSPIITVQKLDDGSVLTYCGELNNISWADNGVERQHTTAHHSAPAAADGPIDIVYLWVDGADPDWAARRRAAHARHSGLAPAPYGDVAGRYRDNGELRYNLRALQRFYPNHGHVYIVTDGQQPRWLRPQAGLTVIAHADLLPAAALPVFDSGHIESYLHHIPGLSERFFYLNDDIFFGAPVEPRLWFGTDQQPLLALYADAGAAPDYAALQPHETALVNAAVLSRLWLQARYRDYRHRPVIFAHAPRPLLKSALLALEQAAPALFEQVRSTVFRSWSVPPLVPDLLPRWLLHHGRAALRGGDPLYVCSGDSDAEAQFQALSDGFGRVPFFCVNDTSDDAADDDPQLRRIGAVLDRLLPLPSAFEWTAAQPDSAV
jgi:hypothetical protein